MQTDIEQTRKKLSVLSLLYESFSSGTLGTRASGTQGRVLAEIL